MGINADPSLYFSCYCKFVNTYPDISLHFMLFSFDYEDHGYEISDLTKVSSIFKNKHVKS